MYNKFLIKEQKTNPSGNQVVDIIQFSKSLIVQIFKSSFIIIILSLFMACGPSEKEVNDKVKKIVDSLKEKKVIDSITITEKDNQKKALTENTMEQKIQELEEIKKNFIYTCKVDEFTNYKEEYYTHKFNNELQRKKKHIEVSVSNQGCLTLTSHYLNNGSVYLNHIGFIIKIGDLTYECLKEPQNSEYNRQSRDETNLYCLQFNDLLHPERSEYDICHTIIEQIALNTDKIIKVRFVASDYLNPLTRGLDYKHDDIILTVNEKKEIKDEYELSRVLKFLYEYNQKQK